MTVTTMQVGAYGTRIILEVLDENDIAVNLATATLKEIILCLEDGTAVAKTATLLTDGSDGKIYCDTAGEITSGGKWSVQAYVELPGGKWYTTIKSFVAIANLR